MYADHLREKVYIYVDKAFHPKLAEKNCEILLHKRFVKCYKNLFDLISTSLPAQVLHGKTWRSSL